ncbi:acyl-CoA N-acyltransferase [Cytidiella melzeri]|nr:acyl-CoA N-acyltransferase [Cytidiella melzeri]
MSNFRLHTFHKPEEYVGACAASDDSFMNYPFGTFLDSLHPTSGSGHLCELLDPPALVVYDDKQLIISMTRMSDPAQWVLGIPRGVEEELSAEEVSAVISLLISGVASAAGLKGFDKVIGPSSLVDALVEGWVAYANEHGQAVKAFNPSSPSRRSYATRASVPPPSPAPSHLKIERLTTNEDAEALLPLMLDFFIEGSQPTLDDEEYVRRRLRVFLELGSIWICRIDGQLVGYSAVGRVTPRTVAIRNVYVAPSHRRRGIAEALTRAVTRFYLGLGFEGAPSDGPAEGAKDEICLNVSREEVERIYKRAGFLLDQADPDTGKPGWFRSSVRSVQYT